MEYDSPMKKTHHDEIDESMEEKELITADNSHIGTYVCRQAAYY